MTRFNEMLQELLEDFQRFLLVTLSSEILSTNALTRKEMLLMKIQHIRQEYPQLRAPSSKEGTPILMHLNAENSSGALSPSSPPPYLEMQGALSSKQPSPILDQKSLNSLHLEDSQEEYEVYDGDRDTSFRSDSGKTVSETETSLLDDSKRDVPEISASELIKSEKHGFLEKKGRERLGGFLSPFQRRWCAIKSGVFYYFDNVNDKRPKGHIDLTGYEARASPSACKDLSKKSFCFELVCPGRKTYQFIALTTKDMKQWISAVERNSKSSNSGESTASMGSDSECSPLRVLPKLPLTITSAPVEKPRSKPLPKTPELEIVEDIYEALDENESPQDDPVYEAEESFENIEQVYIDIDSDGNETEIEFKPMDWYIALWDNLVNDDTELSFQRGDKIRIVDRMVDTNAWWTGVLGEKTGLVPKAFLMEAYEKV